uniref:Uncharacterized protein n=1 Tax=Arundo donax TaxID=35708 RepID=A0A0A9A271_ARUDO
MESSYKCCACNYACMVCLARGHLLMSVSLSLSCQQF